MLVLSGDHAADLGRDIPACSSPRRRRRAATMLTIELDDPGSYGRVVRERGRGGRARGRGESGRGRRRRAARDPRDQRRRLCLRRGPLAEALAGLSNDNAQGEYYLTDVFSSLREAGHTVAAHPPRTSP